MLTDFPHLSTLILLPGLGAFSLAFVRNTRAAKSVAVSAAALELLLAIVLLRFNFSAELLMLLGAFDSHIGLGLAALSGMVLSAAYFLMFFARDFWVIGHRLSG